jgi:hypothetical protein
MVSSYYTVSLSNGIFFVHDVVMELNKPTRPPTSHLAPFGLRMQPDLRARLEKAAADNGRSMNAEIAARLQDSFEVPATIGVQLKELESTLEDLLHDQEQQNERERVRAHADAENARHLKELAEKVEQLVASKRDKALATKATAANVKA